MKKVKYLPSSISAVEHLRIDVEQMTLKWYTLPDAPAGIFNPAYMEKCSTFAAAVSGNGELDYLVVLALRPDYGSEDDEKVLDIDTAAFCFRADDLNAVPSGVALFHQKFDGRTTPLSGYEAFTLEETVNDLHSKLIAGQTPLSAAPESCLNAIKHSIAKFNSVLQPEIDRWQADLPSSTRDLNE